MHTSQPTTQALCSLDPRIKVIFIVVLTAAQMLTGSNFVLLWNYLLLLLLYCLSDKRLTGLKVCTPAFLMVGVQGFCMLLSNNAVAGILGFVAFFLSRLYMFFAIGYWFSVTTKLGDFISSLQSMNLPQGLIISVVVFFRYMPTVGHEFWHISSSMKLRGVGFNLKNLFTHPIRTAEYAIVPLIIRSITIADRLSESAMTRGLNLEHKRSNYRALRLCSLDWFVCVAVCILSLGSLFIA